MKHESRLLWVLIEDLPKLIDGKISFACGLRAYDTAYVTIQLYSNDQIPQLDPLSVDWQYPYVPPNARSGRSI
jgi:hypothetical protein